MKATVFHGPRDVRCDDVAEPKLAGRSDLVIRVRSCSVCGSDMHVYHGRKLGPIDYAAFPMRFCMGHEAIGEVVEVGADVVRHRVGDQVLLAGGVGCGRCEPCGRGAFHLCASGQVLPYGFSPLLQGLQAEYALVRHADLSAMRIPDGFTDEQALLMTDALATAYVGASQAGITPGCSTLVIGLGPIGRLAAEVAFALGAETVVAVDPSAFRRDRVAALGATTATPEEALDRVHERTRGRGADCVIEAVGKDETIQLGIRAARAGGRLAVLGLLERDATTALMKAQLKSLTLFVGVAGVADSWPALVPLIEAGRIRAEGVFTQAFPLARAPEAFALFGERKDTVMKVRIDVRAGGEA